ncbi:MAG: hypothetical protein FD155_3263 [Bacteroidetes bacterium]|nr:MAG: hypothetical protein FD155_3263 [Bacteroidota bacterium]
MREKTTFSNGLFAFFTTLIIVLGLSLNAFAQPPGSTCENPLVVDPVATPLVNYAINSQAYGNDYTSTMIVPSSSYLNGYDIVFQFTLAQKSFINASIAGQWTGLIFVATCPNATTPAPRLAFAGGSTGATVPQFALDAGSYFMIAGTYPAPDFTDMVINFSAVAVPLEPAIVVTPNPLNVGYAVPAFDTKSASLSIRNDGVADLLIANGGFAFSGANAANFSVQLSAGDTYPLTIPFGVTKVVNVVFNPSAVGAASADLTITYNNTTTPTVVVPVSGTGYLASNTFSQNFDGVDPIPAGWLPNAWSKIVQSTATAAVVDVRNIGTPISPPNHARLFNSTDVGATVMLISPAAVNFANSWVRFAAKMSSATHTANVLVGYMTNNYDPATFVSVGTIGVTGTYTQYNVSFLGSGITFPATAYVAFKFAPSVASRTLYIDDIFYEAVPVLPVFTANKTEVNFGTTVFINETASNTLQISNTGAGVMTINQGDITITGADAASFTIVYPGTQTWPIALSTGQTYTFNLRFSPLQARAYVASLNIQDNIGTKALNTIPLLGSGYDATIQPGFMFDFVGTFPPLDWRKFKGLFGTEPVLPTADAIWVHDQFGNNPDLIDPNSAKINLYGTSRRHWLMSPPINLGDGSQGYQLEFDLALTFWNATTPVTLAPEQKFAVVISTDGGLTWSTTNVLKWWNETTPISNTGDHVILDLSAYSGRVMLGFYGEMTVSTAGTIDYDLFVRNVTVTEAVDIEYPEPRNLTAVDAGMSAQLNWAAPILNNKKPAGFGEDNSAAYRSNLNQPQADLITEGRDEGIFVPKGSKSLETRSTLYNNGPFINAPGGGPNGADGSVLQNTSLGMNTLGAGIQFTAGNRMADDFVVGETWTVESFTFYTYQTGSTTTSTLTGGYLQIWNGDPAAGGQIIYGDMTSNMMASTAWTNAYRYSQTAVGTTRPVMSVTCATPGLVLEPGTYWVDYTLAGSLASGPWAPPITINGQTVTGNAKQFLGSSSTWVDFLDTGTGTPAQGLPFLIEGTTGGGGGGPVNGELLGYNIYRNGTLVGNTTADVLTYLDSPLVAGTYTYGVTAVYGQPYPGESVAVETSVTIFSNIGSFPFAETFEGDFPGSWDVYNVDGLSPVWVSSVAQNHTTGGAKSAFHNYGPATQTENGWLVTPMIPLPSGSGIEMKFWDYNSFPTYYGKNSVLVSTGSGNPTSGDFVEVWTVSAVPNPSAWTEEIIDLSAYAGQTIYVAFRYEGSDAHGWYVDDVTIDPAQATNPVITVDPMSLTETHLVPPSMLTTQVVTVTNTGGGDLTWDLAVNTSASKTQVNTPEDYARLYERMAADGLVDKAPRAPTRRATK